MVQYTTQTLTTNSFAFLIFNSMPPREKIQLNTKHVLGPKLKNKIGNLGFLL